MRTRIRAAAAVALLTATGAVMTTTVPVRAYTFVTELERSSSGNNKVSFLERVLYSLMEANNRGAQCRAPRSV
jgi:hypothetical protein